MNQETTQTTASQPASPPVENLLGKRMAAGIIDLIILIVFGAIMTALFGDTSSDDGGFNASLSGVPFLITVGLGLLYYFVLEAQKGQTLGKMALGIKVVSADGGPANAGSIAIRTVLRLVDGIFFYLVAVLLVAVTGKHQRLGDMAANTLVVTAPKP
jgi:uncharacterized RDD family membrane protein YckC